ncbi:MAG: GIY-YIG nuclease family protein [Nanoarchaeota archaeon]|nr:GIY-YIG nuclease family protein [Nanoarchaeota archaeon]
MEKKWFVYLLECLDGSYYTGVTNDVDKRMNVHAERKGRATSRDIIAKPNLKKFKRGREQSKYVYGKGFKKLIAAIPFKNRSEACKAEYEIKQLSKKEKLEWFL